MVVVTSSATSPDLIAGWLNDRCVNLLFSLQSLIWCPCFLDTNTQLSVSYDRPPRQYDGGNLNKKTLYLTLSDFLQYFTLHFIQQKACWHFLLITLGRLSSFQQILQISGSDCFISISRLLLTFDTAVHSFVSSCWFSLDSRYTRLSSCAE